MSKFCPECAHPIIDGNKPFCPKCGAKLPTTSPEVKPPTAAQQDDSIAKSMTKKIRSTGEWIAICCGGAILIVIIAAVLIGGSNHTSSASPSDDKIYTQDLSSMALTTNDFPTGWKTLGTAVNKNDEYKCSFGKLVALTVTSFNVDIHRYTTIDQAKTEFISTKGIVTKYIDADLTGGKVESVSLGNEGYGYTNYNGAFVVFRQGNIIVNTQYFVGNPLAFETYSINDAKKYAAIIADRIKS